MIDNIVITRQRSNVITKVSLMVVQNIVEQVKVVTSYSMVRNNGQEHLVETTLEDIQETILG